MHADIADNLCRIMHVVIEKVEIPLRPTYGFVSTRILPTLDNYIPSVPSFNAQLCPIDEEVTCGRKFTPPPYRFFYHLWKSSIPSPSELSNVLKVLKSLLIYVGPHLHRDVVLLGKLIRVAKHNFDLGDLDENTKNVWLAIVAQHFFPALSQLTTVPTITHELWSLLSSLPYTTRYALYGEWKSYTYAKIPELGPVMVGCRRDVHHLMNRLSKDNVKIQGRKIGMVAASNPTLVFTYILNAIEGYDNMIPVIVDTTKYLSPLCLDILCFCLIEALARETRGRVEDNGTTVEKWVKSLALFGGLLFRRHKVGLEGILGFVVHRAIGDEVYDLVVLQELIVQMGGVAPPEDATVVQLDGFAGGEVLRRESGSQDPQTFVKTRVRLTKALVSTGLAIPLGILIGLQEKEIVYRVGDGEEGSGLKVLGWLRDHVSCQVNHSAIAVFCNTLNS